MGTGGAIPLDAGKKEKIKEIKTRKCDSERTVYLMYSQAPLDYVSQLRNCQVYWTPGQARISKHAPQRTWRTEPTNTFPLSSTLPLPSDRIPVIVYFRRPICFSFPCSIRPPLQSFHTQHPSSRLIFGNSITKQIQTPPVSRATGVFQNVQHGSCPSSSHLSGRCSLLPPSESHHYHLRQPRGPRLPREPCGRVPAFQSLRRRAAAAPRSVSPSHPSTSILWLTALH